LDTKKQIYADKFERYLAKENLDRWFNKPVFKKKRRCFMKGFNIHTKHSPKSELISIAKLFPFIEKFVVVERNNVVNKCPDVYKIEEWETITRTELIEGKTKINKKEFMKFPEYQRRIKTPMVRRAITDEANWLSKDTYNDYPELQEMEFYLRKYCKRNLKPNIKKKNGNS
jgi:hypothetical protein